MLHKFLMSVYPNYFSTLYIGILSQDPFPTLDKAFHVVVQDGRVRTTNVEEKPP